MDLKQFSWLMHFSSWSIRSQRITVLTTALTVFSFGAVKYAEPAEPRGGRVVPSALEMGMNLAPVVDYGTNLPFVDVFKSSRKWIEKSGPITYDATGYPRLRPGQSVDALMVREIDGHYPFGEYVVTYEGTGDVEMNQFDVIGVVGREPGKLDVLVSPANGGLLLQLRKSNEDDPVRNIHVWMPGFEAGEATFNPAFVDRLRGYPVIRFMEWQRTNASPTVEWADRPRVEDARYSTDKGVPLEVMVDLANELGADPWFTIPHRASDGYVREFAKQVRGRLQPSRKVYVEYTNEIWNSMFKQASYAQEKGIAAGLSDDKFLAQLRYYSQRTVEVMKIFEEVFGGTDRLVRVAGSQAATPWVTEKILEWKDAHEHLDALGIAPYFGGSFGKPDTVPEVSTWPTTKLLDALQVEIDGKNKEMIGQQAEVAKKFGVELVAYEGGQHLVGYGGAENDILLTDLFISANRNPRMYDLYKRHLRHWKTQGGGLFVAFNDIGSPSKWGSWGAREYLDQPLAEAPKERALVEAGGITPRPAGVAHGARDAPDLG